MYFFVNKQRHILQRVLLFRSQICFIPPPAGGNLGRPVRPLVSHAFALAPSGPPPCPSRLPSCRRKPRRTSRADGWPRSVDPPLAGGDLGRAAGHPRICRVQFPARRENCNLPRPPTETSGELPSTPVSAASALASHDPPLPPAETSGTPPNPRLPRPLLRR